MLKCIIMQVLRQRSLYSLVHESRQRFFSHVGRKKIIKKNNSMSQIFFGGKNKKNTQMSVFFSCWAHFQPVGGIMDQRI